MRPKSILLIAALLLAVFMLSVPIAQAATITVDTLADIVNSGNSDGACSLREAVISANNNIAMDTCATGSGDDTIVLGVGEYTLTITGADEDASATGDLDIVNSVTIEGAGADVTIINAGGPGGLDDRVFHIMNSPAAPMPEVLLEGISVTGGFAVGIGGGGIPVHGGGISVHDCTLIINKSTIRGNTGSLGGGISVNSSNATISNSTISGNSTVANGGGIYADLTFGYVITIHNTLISGNSAGAGGGVSVSFGIANIKSSTIDNNTAESAGGVIFMQSTGTITNTTISNNSAYPYDGGGVYLSSSSTTTISNSTISGNSAPFSFSHGGGIYSGIATATIINSTISNNSANYGGGISCGPNTINISGIILSGNNATGAGPDCSSTLKTSGYNILNDISGCTFTAATGDLTGIDPLLGPLADNGGPTLTHALLPGSPVIDAGDPACTSGTDQIGTPRPQYGGKFNRCDIGAYEYQAPDISVSSDSIEFGLVSLSSFIDNTVTVTNNGPGDLMFGIINGSDPLRAPFAIIDDTCSSQSIAGGATCEVTVRFEPSTYTAAATGIGGLGIVMLGVVLGSGVTRRRKVLAVLLIGAVMVVGLLTACGSDGDTIIMGGGGSSTYSDTFNVPSNDPDTPNITVNVSGSF